MNKKIKELLEKSRYRCETSSGDAVIIPYDNIEKFANLIILECIKEAKDDILLWSERDQCLVGQVLDRIIKHFGLIEATLDVYEKEI